MCQKINFEQGGLNIDFADEIQNEKAKFYP